MAPLSDGSCAQQVPARRPETPLAVVAVHDRNRRQPVPQEAPRPGPAALSQLSEAQATARPSRDCQHTRVRHEHGTRLAYVCDHCRCPACTDANRLEARRRRTAIAYGTWTGLVDASPSRTHIAELRVGGLSLQGIAALSGVGYGTLARIVYGDPSRDQSPTTQVRSATARRLLQIPTETVRVTDRSRVTSGASRRRLQALAALGWPFPALAVRLGRSPGNLRRTLTTRTVTVASARTIAELYEALRDTAPPTRTPAEITAAGNTRTQARLAGWLPPLAWDDIDVDPDPRNDDDVANMHDSDAWVDEIAVERAMDGDQVCLSRLERDEAIARLTRQGASARRIAELLATSSRNVVRRRRAQRAATSVGPPKRSLATKQRPGLCRAVEPESLTPQAIQPRARHNPELAILGVISSSR